MPTPEENAAAVANALAANLAGPRRVRGDAGEVEQHSVRELIEAAKYLASQDAATKPGRGIRFTKLLPGGTE